MIGVNFDRSHIDKDDQAESRFVEGRLFSTDAVIFRSTATAMPTAFAISRLRIQQSSLRIGLPEAHSLTPSQSLRSAADRRKTSPPLHHSIQVDGPSAPACTGSVARLKGTAWGRTQETERCSPPSRRQRGN